MYVIVDEVVSSPALIIFFWRRKAGEEEGVGIYSTAEHRRKQVGICCRFSAFPHALQSLFIMALYADLEKLEIFTDFCQCSPVYLSLSGQLVSPGITLNSCF